MVDQATSHRPCCASRPARGYAIASVLAAMAAAVLDASSVNVALPEAARALQRPSAQVIWLMISYQAALVAGLLPLAVLGERFGMRRTFRLGTGMFALCALACLQVQDFYGLVLLRVFQGLGAAAIMALGVAMLRQTVTTEEFGQAIAWNAMTVALTSAAGPTFGAVMLLIGGWQFIFIGGLVLACASITTAGWLPDPKSLDRAIDLLAMLLFLLIAPMFAIAVSLVNSRPWVSGALFAVVFAGILILLRRDRRAEWPFLPLDLLRKDAMRRSVMASIACFTGQSLGQIILPFALHAQLDANPLQIAAYLTPWPIAVLLTTPITNRLLARYGTAQLCFAGGMFLSVGLASIPLLLSVAGAVAIPASIVLCGIGFGLFQTPNNRNMFMAAPVDRAASAGGIQGTARLTGQAVGGLLASLLLTSMSVAAAGRVGFLIASSVTLVAALISHSRLGCRD